MKKNFIALLFLVFVASSAFTETYNQIQNRFSLWYTESIWRKLDEKVSTATDRFNQQKTYENAKLLVICVCARYAYWNTAERTARVLHEQLGDSYGNFRYSTIFHQAGEMTKKFSDQCFDIEIYFMENYPNWDFSAEQQLGLYGYYADFFKVATRL